MTGDARLIWQEKLDYYLAEQAKTADPGQKFQLREAIEEARAALAALGEGGPAAALGAGRLKLPADAAPDHEYLRYSQGAFLVGYLDHWQQLQAVEELFADPQRDWAIALVECCSQDLPYHLADHIQWSYQQHPGGPRKKVVALDLPIGKDADDSWIITGGMVARAAVAPVPVQYVITRYVPRYAIHDDARGGGHGCARDLRERCAGNAWSGPQTARPSRGPGTRPRRVLPGPALLLEGPAEVPCTKMLVYHGVRNILDRPVGPSKAIQL